MNAKDIISKHSASFTQRPELTPNDSSVDGSLLGNGDMTVAIGSPDPTRHRFVLSKNDLWCLKSKYGQSCPVPFGSLTLFSRFSGARPFEVTQDLYTATTHILSGKMGLSCYVAAEHNLLIIKISSSEPLIYMRATLDVTDGRGSENQSGSGDNLIWGQRHFKHGIDIPSGAAVSLKVLEGPPLNWDGSFTVSPEAPVTLALSMESFHQHQDPLKETKRIIANLSTLHDIRKTHEAWWSDYWDRSYVSLGNQKIEKQYYLSLYGMGSCSRDLNFPPPIFGWTTTDNPLWAGDYHLNYNHQAPFYGLTKANRLEQADPHDAPFLDFMERGQAYCKKLYGHDGIIYPVGIGPKGIDTTYDSHYLTSRGTDVVEKGITTWGQRSNAAYGIVNMAERWYGTYDHEYGMRIQPYLLQVVTFWEHYLRWENLESEKGQGRFVIDNDSIQEGFGKEFNPCLSLALVRTALEFAIDLSQELENNEEKVGTWLHILNHLSDYPLMEREGKTIFRCTEKGTDWVDGNSLAIQKIYPAGQISLESDRELLEISHNTIGQMQRWMDSNGANSFFPAAVRVGYSPELIFEKLGEYCDHVRSNGFQLNNPHGIENLSTIPNTINEMMCMGHHGVIRVFHVWPRKYNASFKNLRCWGAFLVSSSINDEKIGSVEIFSEQGRSCTVANPWPNHQIQVFRDSKPKEILRGEQLSLDTSKGETVILTELVEK